MKVTLKNDFHNTEVSVEGKPWLTQLNERMVTIPVKTLRRAGMTLCGIKECTCGGFRGKAYDENSVDYTISSEGN